MHGLFVTGTDTGAGKSVVSAALVAAIGAAGEPVRAHKPVLTGLDDPTGEWPRDDELLASVSGADPEDVAPLRFGPAVSPHLAAELDGRPIDPAALLERVSRAGAGDPEPVLIVEGVGGLLVPIARDLSVRDLAAELGMPLVIAARPGLGTISHTLLTIESARSAGLHVAAVVMTPWPAEPGALERSNRETVERLGEVTVAGLEAVGPDPAALASAGGRLPWREWVGPARHGPPPEARLQGSEPAHRDL